MFSQGFHDVISVGELPRSGSTCVAQTLALPWSDASASSLHNPSFMHNIDIYTCSFISDYIYIPYIYIPYIYIPYIYIYHIYIYTIYIYTHIFNQNLSIMIMTLWGDPQVYIALLSAMLRFFFCGPSKETLHPSKIAATCGRATSCRWEIGGNEGNWETTSKGVQQDIKGS